MLEARWSCRLGQGEFEFHTDSSLACAPNSPQLSSLIRLAHPFLSGAMGLVMIIGIDFGGVTPLYRSDLDPWLDKLGIRRIGPVDLDGRAKITGGKITLNQARCTACGICYDVCPRGVYEIERTNPGN